MPLTLCTGFEAGTLAGAVLGTGNRADRFWNQVDQAGGTVAITTDRPHSGLYALRITITGFGHTGGVWVDTQLGQSASSYRVGSGWLRVNAATGKLCLWDADVAAPANRFFLRYNAATNRLEMQGRSSGGTLQGSPAVSTMTIALDEWFSFEWQTDISANPWRVNWRINGIAQAEYTMAFAPDVHDFLQFGQFEAEGNDGTGNFDVDDVAMSSTFADYPLGVVRVELLKPDPAGSLTLSGTAANWNTFSANGTLAAWNAAAALAAIDETPATVGSSADGIAQVTAAAGDYVQVPLTSYQIRVGEIILGARMVSIGWAASSTAATLGFRSWNGTTERILAATADPNFDASTTIPAWLCKMLTLTDVDTQAKLDALALRGGFSDSAEPDIGWHWFAVELAVQQVTVYRVISMEDDTFTVDYQFNPVSDAAVAYLVTTPPGSRGATFNLTVAGTPISRTILPDSTHEEFVDAVDVSTVSDIVLIPDPEPV